MGSTFTVSLPLNSAVYDSYLVLIDKYQQSASTAYRSEDSFHTFIKQRMVHEGESDDGIVKYAAVKRKVLVNILCLLILVVDVSIFTHCMPLLIFNVRV